MTTRYRDLLTGEDMVFDKRGGFKRDPDSFNKSDKLGVLAFSANSLPLLTAQQLSDLKIEAYEHVAPEAPEPVTSTNPVDHPLEPFQFYAMLDILQIRSAVDAALKAITDNTERAVATAKFDHQKRFDRDDPLIAKLAPAVGLTGAQIDTAWMQAKDIE